MRRGNVYRWDKPVGWLYARRRRFDDAFADQLPDRLARTRDGEIMDSIFHLVFPRIFR